MSSFGRTKRRKKNKSGPQLVSVLLPLLVSTTTDTLEPIFKFKSGDNFPTYFNFYHRKEFRERVDF